MLNTSRENEGLCHERYDTDIFKENVNNSENAWTILSSDLTVSIIPWNLFNSFSEIQKDNLSILEVWKADYMESVWAGINRIGNLKNLKVRKRKGEISGQ